MRFKLWRPLLLVVASCALIAAQSTTTPDYAAELKTLKDAYSKDYKAFMEPYSKLKTDEERMKFDWSKTPAKEYLPQFKKIAEKAKGTPAGAQATVEVWSLSVYAGHTDIESAKWAVNELVTTYPSARELTQITGQLAWSYPFKPEEARAILRKIVAGKPDPTVLPQAKMSLANHIMRSDSTKAEQKEARDLLHSIQKDYPNMPAAAEASSLLFELDNLQVGMKAPDFETVDEHGKKWKLSDYRGKVVVVDFWGFW